jgi:nucleoside-triphosphatase
MLIVLTGRPGIGKTTILKRITTILKEKGICVGGVLTEEVREYGMRIGFDMLDVSSGLRLRLASIHGIDGPRIGRYSIDLNVCSKAASILVNTDSDVIVFDEIGPMELLSDDVSDALLHLLSVKDKKSIVVVVHRRFRHKMIDEYIKKASILIEVDAHNREFLPSYISNQIIDVV